LVTVGTKLNAQRIGVDGAVTSAVKKAIFKQDGIR
jgi:hypothetical protein